MALQGTIDAFPVADVLHLLASSHKTGRLIVEGDRSTAQLFVQDGSLTGGSVRDARCGDMVDVVVELLRYGSGSFLFEPGEQAPDPSRSEDLDAVLEAAVGRLATWSEIEAVVPSLLHRLGLTGTIDAEGVTLTAEEWPVIVAAGGRCRVSELVSIDGGSAIEVCAMVAGLVGRGLVVVEEPSADPDPVERPDVPADRPTHGPTEADAVPERSADDELFEQATVQAPAAIGPARSAGDDPAFEVVLLAEETPEESFPERFPIDDLIGSSEAEDPWVRLEEASRADRFAASQSFEGTGVDGDGFDSGGFGRSATVAPGTDASAVDRSGSVAGGSAGALLDPGGAGAAASAHDEGPLLTTAFDGSGAFTDAPLSPGGTSEDTAADEVLRQMAKLSPKAAEAIAAALGSPAGTAPGAVGGASASEATDVEGDDTF